MNYLKILAAISIVVFASNAAGDSFGTQSGPLPNVTEVEVYDVTSAEDKRTGGTLVDSGLNTTLNISQRDETEYRFSFQIENEGNEDWTIAADDTMFHDGLNDSWTINQIWYSTIEDFDGGSFSGGQVQWDTSNGGVLENDTNNNTMYAHYLVDVNEPSSRAINQHFKINDTSNSSGSEDYHELNVTKYGYMNVSLLEPPNDTVLRQNRTFSANVSVTCNEGMCGEVTVTPRYNASGSFSAIPQDSGEPFYTNTSNSKTCDSDLKRDETCYIDWYVNATGDLETYHLLDAQATSSASEVTENDSENHLVQINKAIIMDLEWDTIDFGVLDPGARNRSAEGNSNLAYNISISEDSDPVDDLWVRATDLQSENSDYIIPAENMSYSLENNIDTESFFSNTFRNIRSDIDPGSVLSTFYWVDVPYGIYKGGYTGTVYFKANSTVN